LRIKVISILSNIIPTSLPFSTTNALVARLMTISNALLFGVVELPRGSLEEAARLARHHFHVLRAESQAGAQQSIAVLPTR